MTKRILLSLAAGVVLQTAAWGAACVQGDLASYIALGAGGCTIGDKLFSGFSLASSAGGGAFKLGAGDITVTPEIIGGEIGVEFASLWHANSNQFSDTAIGFDVSVIGGGAFLIHDASIAQSSGGFTGTGTATVSEGLCGPIPCTNTTLTLNTINTAGTTILSDHELFTPVGSVHAVKDIGVTGGTSGTATLSAVTDTFSQTGVPEPTSIVLLGSVMVVVGGFFRRRQSQKV